MIKEVCEVVFFTKEADQLVVDLVENDGFRIENIKDDQEFFDSIRSEDVVVLDGYHFDTQYQKEVKTRSAGLICLDDLHESHFVADYVLNHAPGVSEGSYQASSETEFLLGAEYALLRPEFLRNHDVERNLKPPLKRILICFGGSDFKDVTTKVISWIPDQDFEITIISGAAYPYGERLETVIGEKKQARISVKKALSASQMRDEMARHQLAIVPASGILFEAIAVGVPVITGYYTENQMDIYKGFLAQGAAFDARDFGKEAFQKAFFQAIQSDPMEMLEKQRMCIDRRSPERIREKVLSLC